MGMVGIALLVLGGIVALIGLIWLLVAAFQESVLWGLGSLLVPFVALIFVIMHWDKGGKPFLVNLGGVALVVVGSFMTGTLFTQ